MRSPQDALDWVHSETGHRVTATRKLYGGLTSEMQALTLANGESLVLRAYTEWGKGASPQVKNEEATLKLLERSGIPAPRVIATKASGPVPLVLMTRLPGRVWLAPRDSEDWLGQMARMLVKIHAVPIAAKKPDPKQDEFKDFEVPDWTTRRDLWERCRPILMRKPAAYTPSFVHSDYQHFNVLWSGRKLSGIVDWVYAGPGHPDADVAHCRLNLAILFSIEYAERFREIYEAESGRRIDPWWDLKYITSYDQGWKEFIPLQVHGRAKVDRAGMDARIERLIDRILARV